MTFTEPYIDDTKCYGVRYGKPGEIWAVMEGALVVTTDGGTNFAPYSPSTVPEFNPAALLVAGWDSVKIYQNQS